MSGTLALAESIDTSVGGSSKSQIVAPITSAGLASHVLIDGLDFVPPMPYGSICPQWYDLAMQYFSPAEWNTIDFLLNRESRCDSRAFTPLKNNNIMVPFDVIIMFRTSIFPVNRLIFMITNGENQKYEVSNVSYRGATYFWD